MVIKMSLKLGYIKDDLSIYYQRTKIYEVEKLINSDKNKFKAINNLEKLKECTIIYFYRGEFKLRINNEFFDVYDGCIMVLNSHNSYEIVTSRIVETELIKISFLPNVFSRIDDNNKDIMRCFENPQKVFMPTDYSKTILNSLFSALKAYTFKHYGRIYLETNIAHILCELCTIYDELHTEDSTVTSHIPTQITNYIETHFNQKLTLQMLCDKFSASTTTINMLIKNMTGKTFKQYLNSVRLETARNLLINKKDAVDIYKLCGFEDYSGFYRAYTNYFGHSPSHDKIKNERWPLT